MTAAAAVRGRALLVVMIMIVLRLTNAFVRVSQRSRAAVAYKHVLASSSKLYDDFEACWAANTWSVNPSNDKSVDIILQGLCSPAPQSLSVLNRALEKNKSEILSQCTWLLKPRYEFQVMGDEWRVEPATKDASDWCPVKPDTDCVNAAIVAHEALDMAIAASESQIPIDKTHLRFLVQQAKDRLSLTLGTDIRGRSSADVAFCFCMAGVTDEHLYSTLAKVATLELKRIGHRESFRPKFILQMVEKLAASGWKDGEVYRVAADCLASKEAHLDVVKTILRNEFDLLSTRPLLWLWRFSARQRKVASTVPVGEATRRAIQHDNRLTLDDWVSRFDDPTLPLVVDIGCGMGASLLGLATLDQARQDSFNTSPDGHGLEHIDWRQCNYVGGDLSQLTIGYGRGIAQRWNVDGKLQFTYASAMDLMNSVKNQYPGKVALIMVQFPTPFKLKEAIGNRQLPSDATSGFMVSEGLLKSAADSLNRSNGFLVLQSNCEDVAVTIREMAEDSASFGCIPVPSVVVSTAESASSSRTPERTTEWIRQGGTRAVGSGWSLTPLIPSRGSTETEIACQLNETPIHRCLLKPRKLS
jgi:SAM-dependent methyltransferase